VILLDLTVVYKPTTALPLLDLLLVLMRASFHLDLHTTTTTVRVGLLSNSLSRAAVSLVSAFCSIVSCKFPSFCHLSLVCCDLWVEAAELDRARGRVRLAETETRDELEKSFEACPIFEFPQSQQQTSYLNITTALNHAMVRMENTH